MKNVCRKILQAVVACKTILPQNNLHLHVPSNRSYANILQIWLGCSECSTGGQFKGSWAVPVEHTITPPKDAEKTPVSFTRHPSQDRGSLLWECEFEGHNAWWDRCVIDDRNDSRSGHLQVLICSPQSELGSDFVPFQVCKRRSDHNFCRHTR